MGDVRIRYTDLPDVLDAEIRASCPKWARYLPGWVRLLTIAYDDTDLDNYAGANAMFDQREALVTIHPLFWSRDAQGRAETPLHEYAHILLAPIDQAVETIIETNPGKAAARKIYSDAMEGVVNDFAALGWDQEPSK